MTLLSFLLAVRVALGVLAQPGDVRGALQELAQKYKGLSGVAVESEMVERPVPKSGSMRKRFAISSEGRFAVYEFRGTGEAKDLKANLEHGVFYDGELLRASEVPHQYVEVRPNADFLRGRGPVHFFEAPWAILRRWTDALLGASDLETSRQGETFLASSASVGLGLEWSADGRLLAAKWIAGPNRSGIRVEYAGFVPTADLPPMPREVVWKYTITRVGESKPQESETRWAVKRIDPNPQDIRDRLAFDAQSLSLDRFDTETHNVYAPDGTLKYNEDEYVKNYQRAFFGSQSMSNYIYALIVLAVGGSLFLAYRRFRPGGA